MEPSESSLVRSISARVGRAAGFESKSSVSLGGGRRSVMLVCSVIRSSGERENKALVIVDKSGEGVTAVATAA